jgi:hypothetical protein
VAGSRRGGEAREEETPTATPERSGKQEGLAVAEAVAVAVAEGGLNLQR